MAPEKPPLPSPTPAPAQDLGLGPTLAPVTHVPTGAAPFYTNGTDDRPTDNRVVAVSIGVRVDMKFGDREVSAPMCLHEIPTMTRYHEAMTGSASIRLSGGWPPALPRFRRLNQDNLVYEARRLMRQVVPRKDAPPFDPFSLFYPGTEREKVVRLHGVMRKQLEAWNALLLVAKSRVPNAARIMDEAVLLSMAGDYITEQELWTVVRLGDPSASESLSEIVLPEVDRQLAKAQELAGKIDRAGILQDGSAPVAPASVTAPAPVSPMDAAKVEADKQDDPIGDAVAAAFSRLKEAGFDDAAATAVSALLEPTGEADTVTDDQIKSAGVAQAQVGAARRALRG